ncbi:IDEAL domain-containing protein [Bacillus sp. EB600]|uniref:IDEAL domain-containing protein n=1 Tax=Bacillus sp. EB600 TaxID=2806345 RepID=UPI00281184AF|nr:IDEAL domain-containing protein [Bacillus sp. EB600]
MIFLKDKSYTELMKISAMNRNQAKENFIQNLYIEIMLAEIQLTLEKEKLVKRIDNAIDDNDKETFLLLSKEFIELTKRFGT